MTTKVSKSRWMKASNGEPSMSATFACVAFFTTTVLYALSAFEKVGPLTVRTFDATACGAYLIPVLSLYFGRRWSENKKVTQIAQGMVEAIAPSDSSVSSDAKVE